MNFSRQSDHFPASVSPAEETLRLIARLPAPEGLVDRVQAGLRSAPRSTRLLRWPMALQSGGLRYGSALRGAAAAAMVCLVAGGGWQIYSHVQPAPSAQVKPLPARIGSGFSSAGAMRTPDSSHGPVLTQALVAAPQGAVGAAKPAAKASPEPRAAKKHKKAVLAAVPQR